MQAICGVNIEECNENESANSRHDFIIPHNQLLGGVRIAAHILTVTIEENFTEIVLLSLLRYISHH